MPDLHSHVADSPSDQVWPQTPMLPPCRICSEKASGFHYGVNTCEACKAFFRRSLKKFETFKCAAVGSCSILPGKRSSCSFCRFQKCVAMGMCRDAIKTGRYTHKKIAMNIKEVKGIISPTMKSPKTSPRQPKSFSPSNSLQPGSMKVDDSSSCCSSGELSSVVPSPDLKRGMGAGVLWFDESQTEFYDSVVKRFVEIHEAHFLNTKEFLDQLPAKESEFLERLALRNQVFGPMKTMSRDEYAVFYRATGIDIDGRRELIETVFLPQIDQVIKNLIRFTKAIPGFNNLCIEDQIALVKSSRFDSFVITGHRRFNPENKLVATPMGEIIDDDGLTKIKDRSYVDALFALQLRLKGLKLTVEETCVMAAFAIMFTDHCPLKNPEIVERSQEQLLACLGYLFHKYHPEERMRFSRVVNCLLQIRTTYEENIVAEGHFVHDWAGIVEFPPLFYEMWAT